MRDIRRLPALAVALVLVTSCNEGDRDIAAFMQQQVVQERRARFDSALQQSQRGDSAVARWRLPVGLREASGLALTKDGRLLVHGDEGGTVAEVDYRTGVIVNHFRVAADQGPIDFEGMAVVGDAIFMIASNGDVYQSREGSEGEAVEYAVHRTELAEECEFEGIAYDPSIESLLLSCKEAYDQALEDSLVIFRLPVPTLGQAGGPPATTRLTVPLSRVTGVLDAETLRPSDITVDPRTGNYVLIAAQEHALVELTPAGNVVSVRKISDAHEQAEGLAITDDGILIIADEATRLSASITLYRKP